MKSGVSYAMGKVLVIGLDGATLDLLKPWMDEGYLPTLSGLAGRGVAGNLDSVVPPITGPAWSSFVTGQNPGRHGIFDWLARSPGGYSLEPVSSHSIASETLWDIIGRHGCQLVAIGVPVTFPPKPVNGVLVSSILTPHDAQVFTYPPELSRELTERFDYRIMPKVFYDRWRIDEWLEALHELVDIRTAAAEHLLVHQPWDFFMVHFLATDMVQHGLWFTIDPRHPDHAASDASAYAGGIRDLFTHVDRNIATLLKELPDDTMVIVMSDHGFGPVYNYIYLNNFLLRAGYMSIKRNPLSQAKYMMYRLGITPARVYRLLMRLGLLSRGLAMSKGERYNLVRRFFLSVDDIDWNRTRAYAHGNIGQIYINLKGREPQGCVEPGSECETVRDEIMARLRQVEDPMTGRLIIQEIYRREEIYEGDRLDMAPDIVMLPHKLEYQAIGVSEFVSNQVVERSFAFSGGHRMNGLLMAAGPDIQPRAAPESASLTDLAPTILHLMGLPVPQGMDGRVLTELLTAESCSSRPVRYEVAGQGEAQAQLGGFSEKEAEEIMGRLRDLGYVS